MLVFNKWTTPDAERANRLRVDYQAIFECEYGVTAVPCFFIDSFFNVAMLRDNADDGTQSVRHLHASIRARTQAQLNALVAFLVDKQSECDVRTIETKETERQALIRERQALELKRQQEEEEHRRLVEQQRIEHERQLYAHRIHLCLERCAHSAFRHLCIQSNNATKRAEILTTLGK